VGDGGDWGRLLGLVGVGTGLGVFAARSASSPALAHEATLRRLGALADALGISSGDATQASAGGGVVVIGADMGDVQERLLLLGVGIVRGGSGCGGVSRSVAGMRGMRLAAW
jgi:hypothetical protein